MSSVVDISWYMSTIHVKTQIFQTPNIKSIFRCVVQYKNTQCLFDSFVLSCLCCGFGMDFIRQTRIKIKLYLLFKKRKKCPALQRRN